MNEMVFLSQANNNISYILDRLICGSLWRVCDGPFMYNLRRKLLRAFLDKWKWFKNGFEGKIKTIRNEDCRGSCCLNFPRIPVFILVSLAMACVVQAGMGLCISSAKPGFCLFWPMLSLLAHGYACLSWIQGFKPLLWSFPGLYLPADSLPLVLNHTQSGNLWLSPKCSCRHSVASKKNPGWFWCCFPGTILCRLTYILTRPVGPIGEPLPEGTDQSIPTCCSSSLGKWGNFRLWIFFDEGMVKNKRIRLKEIHSIKCLKKLSNGSSGWSKILEKTCNNRPQVLPMVALRGVWPNHKGERTTLLDKDKKTHKKERDGRIEWIVSFLTEPSGVRSVSTNDVLRFSSGSIPQSLSVTPVLLRFHMTEYMSFNMIILRNSLGSLLITIKFLFSNQSLALVHLLPKRFGPFTPLAPILKILASGTKKTTLANLHISWQVGNANVRPHISGFPTKLSLIHHGIFYQGQIQLDYPSSQAQNLKRSCAHLLFLWHARVSGFSNHAFVPCTLYPVCSQHMLYAAQLLNFHAFNSTPAMKVRIIHHLCCIQAYLCMYMLIMKNIIKKLKFFHQKRSINNRKRRNPETLQNENKGNQTIKTSTPRAKPHQRKLYIHSNHTRSMLPRGMKVSTLALRISHLINQHLRKYSKIFRKGPIQKQ
ncbi:hypothetical protein VP01_1225g3 [Puccinia sorghi]|uniref:Uncharacterized protein n=1 Tax=Puccinia sorghi TaxID=27349 RepID=A0A0L6VQ50_9BASI|nr:hypothetical protein VP01_1225g3 [Puccinia sorghi]